MSSRTNLAKIYNVWSKHWIVSRYSLLPSRSLSTPTSSETDAAKKTSAVVNNVLDDLREPELSEEEILRKRFKARLPERIYRKCVTKEPVSIDNKYDLHVYRLRCHFGKFGKDSKLNPGLCWPTREEILETIEYDKIFEPPLEERIRNIEAKRTAEETRKREVEAEVDKNMANLDKSIADYHSKIEKKNAKARELKLQREKLVEEISEYLGYDIDPKDPRFKEAVEQRDKEKKKAMKVKKQQESYDKMLEKLRKIAETKQSS